MPINTIILPISMPKEMAKELDKAAKSQNMTRSEFIRGALRKQATLAQVSKFRTEFSRRAKKAGVKTLNDAVKLVKEAREKKYVQISIRDFLEIIS